MDFLANKIMIHFHETVGKSVLEMKKDIESFLRANGGIRKAKVGENIDPKFMMKAYKYCEQLKNVGFLLDFGNDRKVPILGNKYINLGNDIGIGEYGGYDFFIARFSINPKIFFRISFKSYRAR